MSNEQYALINNVLRKISEPLNCTLSTNISINSFAAFIGNLFLISIISMLYKVYTILYYATVSY